MHAGSSWILDKDERLMTALKETEIEVMRQYFVGKEISLGAEGLKFKEPLGGVSLIPINQGLTCGPPESLDRRKCRDTDYFNLPDPPDDTVLGKCAQLVPKRTKSYINLMGPMKHNGRDFCVYVGVHEGVAKGNPSPHETNIDNDELYVTVRDVARLGEQGGEGGAGGLAGGPRVNSRPLQRD